jgi:hypothetical protein
LKWLHCNALLCMSLTLWYRKTFANPKKTVNMIQNFSSTVRLPFLSLLLIAVLSSLVTQRVLFKNVDEEDVFSTGGFFNDCRSMEMIFRTWASLFFPSYCILRIFYLLFSAMWYFTSLHDLIYSTNSHISPFLL